jgi:hypothetical protein
MSMNPRLLRPTGGFNPKSIAGLALWLDATKTSSMLFNNNNNPPTVSQWDDLSGNGYHATQGTDNNRPTYQATGMNGRPALEFTSSFTNRMETTATIANVFATPTTSPQCTIFAVMRNLAGQNSASFGSNSDANGRLLFSSRLLVATSFFDVVDSSAGRLSATKSTVEADAAAVHTLFKSGATQTIRYNGSEKATKTNATSNFAATSATIQVGKVLNGTTASGGGFFSELLFYARALSATEIATVERYLAGKYGFTLA